MAGKGSRPRRVDKKTWDENYDKIFSRRRTVLDWQTHFGDMIKSYDGFREYNEDDLLTEKEYQIGLLRCTVYIRNFIIEDGNLNQFDQLVVNDSLAPWKH